jgi:homoserine O-acetyltransferase
MQGSGIGSDTGMLSANHRLLAASARLLARSYASTSNRCSTQAMKDEYGVMDDSGHTYVFPGDYDLECGALLSNAQLRYQTYGELNEARDNVVVVCHALTGNASLHAWWGDMLGPGRAFDTDKYFFVCSNILGSCYGSTCPVSINPSTGQSYGKDFPDVSVKDTVRLQLSMLKDDLQVESIQCVIGGSFGGMQSMEFAAQAGSVDADFTTADGQPYMRSVLPIACGAAHTAWQIGISEVQRQAIYKDPNWATNPDQATAGLEVARQLGMISYRTPLGYDGKFARAKQQETSAPYGSGASWKVKSYLEYQGKKFLDRFDPVTYVKMTEQMDSHDLARGRGDNLEKVLQKISIPALVLGIDSDVLYPLYEQEFLAEHLPAGRLEIIHSDDGHDGFLLEQEQVGKHIKEFLSKFD